MTLDLDTQAVIDRAIELLPGSPEPMEALRLAADDLARGWSDDLLGQLATFVVARRCVHETPRVELGDFSFAPRCALWAGHDGDHEPGCSECWDHFHPMPGFGPAVNARSPWCPIRNAPCVRERGCAEGMRLVVRPPAGGPWYVATLVREEGGALIVRTPDGRVGALFNGAKVISARGGGR